jgi:ornithine carbamoyltransferase
MRFSPPGNEPGDEMEKKDFLSFFDFSEREIAGLLQRGLLLKKRWKRGIQDQPLRGMTLGLLFDKPSTRTRVSFEVAMTHLGGHSIYLDPGSTQIGRGETVADSARVLSRYVNGLVVRTFAQEIVEEWARWSAIPVINGLTDLLHPCQVLCDLLTIVEKRGKYRGLKIAYVGDGNNMANTWLQAASMLDFSLSLACPTEYWPDYEILSSAKKKAGDRIQMTTDPLQGVRGADIIYTDTWASMGQEQEREKRLRHFEGYQVDSQLLRQAKKGAWVMHCLPAHAGEEISLEVIEGPQSIVFDQAENRLHGQKAILEYLLKKRTAKSRKG